MKDPKHISDKILTVDCCFGSGLTVSKGVLIKVFDVLSIYDETYRLDCKNQCFSTNYITVSDKKYNGIVAYYIKNNIIYKWIVEARQSTLERDGYNFGEIYNRTMADFYNIHGGWDFL